MKLSKYLAAIEYAYKTYGDREVYDLATFGPSLPLKEVNFLDGDHLGYPGGVVLSHIHEPPYTPSDAERRLEIEKLAALYDEDEAKARSQGYDGDPAKEADERMNDYAEGEPIPCLDDTGFPMTPQEEAWYKDYYDGHSRREALRKVEEARDERYRRGLDSPSASSEDDISF